MPLPEQNSIATQAAKALGITQLVPTIYQDVLQPAAQEAGQRLVVVAQTVGIALAPFEAAVWGYQRVKDYLSAKVAAKLADKPPTEIISPDPVIAGPVIMSMIFAADAPHLREMYANLIAHAMHSPSASKAHPSFVQIIQQLSSVEARILQDIAGRYSAGEVIFGEQLRDSGISTETPGRYIFAQWRSLCVTCGVADGSLADAFYHNLIRLGILIERSETEAKYFPEGGNDHGTWGASVNTRMNNSVMLTNYGDLFCDVCVRDA